MRLRTVAAVLAAAALAGGCGQSDRILDARVDADRMLVRTRTESSAGTVQLRNGEKIRAAAVDLQPERTRWIASGEDGEAMSVDVPTVSLRSIRLSEPRRSLWKHFIAGAALGALVVGVLSADFGDGETDASSFLLGGGIGAAGGTLGGLSGRSTTYEIVGGEEPAPPPP
jgi:hypothetical protein